jgi:HEAT repeat protein
MYVAAPPVIVAAAPAVQAAPVTPPVYPGPPLAPVVARSAAADPTSGDIERQLQLLASADERVRSDSVIQLGRLRARQAIDPLAATLAGDRSTSVREAAARALGLIGSPQALPALERAAQGDASPEVRHSAQFAVEVIQARG